MTCCISVWGDGSAGPLGITVPEGMLTAKFIAEVNRERQGKVYILTSGSNTHFMNAETTVELLEKLFMPAFKRQRQKHNLAHTVPGILQCDAWPGNFADSSGENLQRSLLFDQMNVIPPDRQPRGWSAKGQAADKINGHFKRRSDAYTDAVLGFNHDLLNRPRFEDCILGPTGTLARKIAPEEAVFSAIWAWETMDPVLFQWAFPAVGYVSKAEMAEFNGLKECDLQANFDKAKKLVEDSLTLGRVPELETPALLDVMSTIQPGEKRHLWQIEINEETWRALPEVLPQRVEINSESVERDDLEPNYDTGMEALEAGEANEPHLLEPETGRDTADEVTSDNDAASDGAADGGLDGDNDIDIVEIFDHDIDPDNLVSLPPKPAAVYKASIDGCITPAVEKLLLPPIRGCKLQRRDYPPTTTTYQAWYPVREGKNSHCCSWGPLGVASLEEAREVVVNWCWEHHKVAVGCEEAATMRSLQYQRFLDATANVPRVGEGDAPITC